MVTPRHVYFFYIFFFFYIFNMISKSSFRRTLCFIFFNLDSLFVIDPRAALITDLYYVQIDPSVLFNSLYQSSDFIVHSCE